MFTGIIRYLGIYKGRNRSVLTFDGPMSLLSHLTPHESIAINGVCLTITKKPTPTTFTVAVIPETLRRTTLGMLSENTTVNLEPPATPTTFLSGHIVQGHIDGIGHVRSIVKEKNSRIITISIPQSLARYIVTKGSIAIDGISLTIIDAFPDGFSVGIIPFTWKHTTLSLLKVKQTVNLEVDCLAKYMVRVFGRIPKPRERRLV